MRSGFDHQRSALKPGQKVPTSGIYTAVHLDHRSEHDVVAIQGEEFPTCRVCKHDVRFYISRLLPHMTHDFDLTGPEETSLRSRAKAAAKGKE